MMADGSREHGSLLGDFSEQNRTNININSSDDRAVEHDFTDDRSAAIQHQQDDFDGTSGRRSTGTTTLGASFSYITTVVGGGVLALPGLMARSGWSGLLMLSVFACLAAFTGHELVRVGRRLRKQKKHDTVKHRTSERTPSDSSMLLALPGDEEMASLPSEETNINFEHISEYAFGFWGKVFGMAVQYGSLAGGVSLYLVFIGDALQQLACQANLYEPIDFRIYTISVFLVLVPIVGFVRNLSSARFISLFGVVAVAVLALAVVVLGLVYPPPPPPQYIDNLKLLPSSFWDYAIAYAGFTFAFEGHACLPSIENEMRSRDRFPRMLICSYVVIALVYLLVSSVGYEAYGQCAQPIVTENLAPGVLAVVATAAVLIRTVAAVPIVLHPVCLSVEENLKITRASASGLLRVCLLTACTAVAVLVPNFQQLLALVGASCVANSVFVLPALISMKLDRDPGWKWRMVVMSVSLFVGVVCAVVGTVSAVVELIGTTDWSFSADANCGAARPFTDSCSFSCSEGGDFTSVCQ